MLELWQTLLSKWRLGEKVHQGITYRLVSKSFNCWIKIKKCY